MLPSLTTLQIGMTASKTRAGGVDRYYFNLLRAMANNGVKANGLVAGHPSAVDDMPGVTTYAGERESMPMKWMKIRRAAKPMLAESDVVVSHFAPYALPLMDRLGNKPLVVHFHGPWAQEAKAEGAGSTSVAVKHRIERAVYGAASRVITLSPAFAEIVTRDYGVPSTLVDVIPGGVDLGRFETTLSRTEARTQLGWPTDRPTIVTVRRLVHAKGVENLIRAAALLRDRMPNLFMAIVGTGPLAESLQQSIVDLGLENNVRMIGQVSEDDLPNVYRAADLFVVPTITLEGFGLVVVEALASGTPVLVTPVGGLPDVVRDLNLALVLQGSEPEHIAKGIADALIGDLRLPTDTECVDYAQRFCWSGVARSVGDVYRDVALQAASGSLVQPARMAAQVRAHSY